MQTLTADEVYEDVVRRLPPDEQIRLVARIADALSRPRSAASPDAFAEVMARIRERQRVRGHQPRSREEVDAYLERERASWGD